MGWTHRNSQRTTTLCVKLNTCACRGIPWGKYFKGVPHVWEKKKWCIICQQGRVQSQLFFWNFTLLARMWSNHNIVKFKFQYSRRVWTLLVQGRESYFIWWAHVVEWSPRKKIRIEFQRGNKLLGTSLEALEITRWITVQACYLQDNAIFYKCINSVSWASLE